MNLYALLTSRRNLIKQTSRGSHINFTVNICETIGYYTMVPRWLHINLVSLGYSFLGIPILVRYRYDLVNCK